MDSAAPPTGRPLGSAAALGLFGLSTAMLSLEILQTRLFSYCLDPLLFYAAVGIALLGMGAAGTFLSLWDGWRHYRLGSLAAWATAGFVITLLLSHAVFARTSRQIDLAFDLLSIAAVTLLAVPYFLGGAVVTVCLRLSGARVHHAYMINLIGSAAGCFTVFFALKPLGAPRLLCAIAILGALAGLLFALRNATRSARIAAASSLVIALAGLLAAPQLFPFAPDRKGQLAAFLDKVKERYPNVELAPRLEYDAWDPTGRIQLHRLAPMADKARVPAPLPYLFFSQDGSAGSIILGVQDRPEQAASFFERTLYGAVYALRDGARGDDVLVIGLGGGPDVLGAELQGAKRITAVDINASAIEAVGKDLADFSGHLYDRPGVSVHCLDGRTFVRSSPDSYDLIIMSGVDTKAVLAAGSLAISENHLYTVEAFEDYLSHLRKGGVLALLRFGRQDLLRLIGIGVSALRRQGVEHPERHFAILTQDLWWISVLVSRDPLSPQENRRLVAWVDGLSHADARSGSPGKKDTGVRIPVYDVIGFGLGRPPELHYPVAAATSRLPLVDEFFEAVAAGNETGFLESLAQNLSPTTDDRPFFFDHQRPSRLLTEPTETYRSFGRFLATTVILALLLILLPIPLVRRGTTRARGLPATLIYFMALGAGFMLLEIGLVQKLVLFLGHQQYAITVVLATLLFGAGLGSGWAGRRGLSSARPVRRFAVPAIVIYSTALLAILDLVAPGVAGAGQWTRILVSTAALLPLGFVLGIPFPTALATLTRTAPRRVAWAIGANGLASVLGASVALPASMLLGYRLLFVVGCACYVVAAIAFPASREGEAEPRPTPEMG